MRWPSRILLLCFLGTASGVIWHLIAGNSVSQPRIIARLEIPAGTGAQTLSRLSLATGYRFRIHPELTAQMAVLNLDEPILLHDVTPETAVRTVCWILARSPVRLVEGRAYLGPPFGDWPGEFTRVYDAGPLLDARERFTNTMDAPGARAPAGPQPAPGCIIPVPYFPRHRPAADEALRQLFEATCRGRAESVKLVGRRLVVTASAPVHAAIERVLRDVASPADGGVQQP